MRQKKRGISTIIATVLILLLTVSSVTLLWAAIIPLVEKNLSNNAQCINVQTALEIDTNIQYTCYHTNGSLSVRVKRKANTDDLEGFVLSVNSGGNTLASPTGAFTQTNLQKLTPNGARVYTFSPTDTGISSFNNPVTLRIAPLLLFEGEKTACDAGREIEIDAC